MLMLAGCAVSGARKDLLDFLQPGTTTRAEVLTRLGAPSASFEHDSILTYKISTSTGHGYYVRPRAMVQSWYDVKYSLVLVFNTNSILQKKSLVDVK